MAKLHLAVGAYGEEVRDLHRRLIASGLEIPANEAERAFFGPATRYAVLEWQQKHRLPVTGIVDERTGATFEAAAQSPSVGPQSPGRLESPQKLVTQSGPTDIFAREISQSFAQARYAASKGKTRDVMVNGKLVPVRYPFQSP